uniref:zinc-ribbon domain-containing protein n=1 Tax=Anaeromyxobacter sp. SG26 TaxID=2925407 RepID=UPI001F57764C
MRVGCPHCHAAYNIDDRRIPASGLNVRCPKCRETFPVRPADTDGAARPAGDEPVPLPGKTEGAVPLAPPASAGVPLPPPPSAGVPLPAPRSVAAGVPLPPPALPAPDSVPLPPPIPAAPRQDDPLAPPSTPGADPFGADVPDATADAVEATPDGGALGFGEVELGAGRPAAPPPPSLDDTDPFAPAPGASPFGAASPAAADPFGAPAPAAPEAPPAHPPAAGGENLEMLFGE